MSGRCFGSDFFRANTHPRCHAARDQDAADVLAWVLSWALGLRQYQTGGGFALKPKRKTLKLRRPTLHVTKPANLISILNKPKMPNRHPQNLWKGSTTLEN